MAHARNPLTQTLAFPDLGTRFNNMRAQVVAKDIQRYAQQPHGWTWLEPNSTNPNHHGQAIPAEHEPEVV